MKEYELLYLLKDLEKNIALFLIKDKPDCCKLQQPTPTQIQIVNYILKHDEENIYQKDIEKSLNLSRATLSGVLNTMEKHGMIKRVVNTTDLRSKKIVLNEETKNIFEKSRQRLSEAEKILIENVNKKELETFLSVLNKMKENINKQNNNERMIKHDKIN